MKKVIKKSNNLDFKIDSIIETIDSLAISVARGFDNMATRNDVSKIYIKLDDIDHRLGSIEHNHTRRIENLEDKVRIFSTIFEKNLKIKIPK
ncbi:MAG TPA: hypothetical protein VMR49_00765 [Candidatus Paceibacterota bacterium]|jgi:hypothetical protein|nr:hypothetical protein [Candidatus Paceibacterota bacterium]